MGFNRLTKSVLNISGLPDRVQNQASALKALFDQAGVDIKEALNALMSELEASTSASNIGADVTSVATKTVQAILTAYEEAIADRYTKLEAGTLVLEETNNLVADVDVNLTTGVITVTKKDGTIETFDTAIEKVPAKFEIVETNGKYALKITNVDGTSTQTDITNLMNIYNFNSSDTVNFEVTGEGNEKAVVATVKDNSIGLDKLSLTVISTLEGYMNSAKDSATAAKTSETNARTSEINAANSASTATNKATEATTAATTAVNASNTATTKASAAQKSAEDAEYWANKAQEIGGGDFVTKTEFNSEINNRYTKAETDTKISTAVANKTDKSYVDGQISAINTELANKANSGDVNNYLSAINTSLLAKADKTYVDNAVSSIVVPNIQTSTTDLEAGVSELATGNIYFVYE